MSTPPPGTTETFFSDFSRLERQKSLSELKHLEYVLQKGLADLDGRDSSVSKKESEVEELHTAAETERYKAKEELEVVTSLKQDLQQKIQVLTFSS